MPQPRAINTHVSESWDDDFDFASTAPSRRASERSPTSAVPHASPTSVPETWDDAYESEDSPNYTHAPAITPDTDGDGEVDSWGSGSDYRWSGTNESGVEATAAEGSRPSTHTSSQSSSSVPHSPARSSSGSFFARLSPVKKWKVLKSPKDPNSSPTTPPQASSLKRIFLPPPISTPSKTSRPLITSPRTPDSKAKWSAHPIASNLPLADSLPATSLQVTPRRSSLSDLRRPQLNIPSRISHAQRDIKRDMADVKEFASCVKQLQTLQHVYTCMLRDLHAMLSPSSPPFLSSFSTPFNPPFLSAVSNTPESPASAKLPTRNKRSETIHLPHTDSSPKPAKRKFSFTPSPRRPSQVTPSSPSGHTDVASPDSLHIQSPDFTATLARLTATYGVWWECAHILVELGGNDGEEGGTNEVVGAGAGWGLAVRIGPRPRAVTLASERPVSISADTDIVDHKSEDTGAPGAGANDQGRDRKSGANFKLRHATTGRVARGNLTPRQIQLFQSMLELGGEEVWDPRAVVMHLQGEPGHGGNGYREGRMKRGLRELWTGMKKTQTRDVQNGEHKKANLAVGRVSKNARSPEKDGCKMVAFSSPPKRKVSTSPERDAIVGIPLISPSENKTATVTPANAGVLSLGKKPLRRPSLAGIFGGGTKDEQQEIREKGSKSTLRRIKSKTKLGNSSADAQSSHPQNSSSQNSSSSSLSLHTQHSSFSASKKARLRPKFITKAETTPSAVVINNSIREPQYSSSSSSTAQNLPVTIRRQLSSSRLSSTLISPLSPSPATTRPFVTPEDIRPLLLRAREVAAHLNDCIGEVRTMMGGMGA